MSVASLATIGLSVSIYLAAYQFGITHDVWEPFFGDGSKRALHSFISRLLPVPDAAAGAFGYAVELMATLIGGADRSRKHPRFVLLYGGIVTVLALAGLGLTAVQAFLLRTGCTLCLFSAAISLSVALIAREEVAAAWREVGRK